MKVKATVTLVYEYDLDPSEFDDADEIADGDAEPTTENDALGLEETSIVDAFGSSGCSHDVYENGELTAKVEKIG